MVLLFQCERFTTDRVSAEIEVVKRAAFRRTLRSRRAVPARSRRRWISGLLRASAADAGGIGPFRPPGFCTIDRAADVAAALGAPRSTCSVADSASTRSSSVMPTLLLLLLLFLVLPLRFP
jgi:hypothetical protein